MPSFRLMSILASFTLVAHGALAAVPVPKPPSIDARAYVLVDFQSGRVLAAELGTSSPDFRIPAHMDCLMKNLRTLGKEPPTPPPEWARS